MIEIQSDVDLLPYNTFQVSCIAKYFVVVKTVEEVQELIMTEIWKTERRRLFLGGGSNMLLATPRYDGLVVKNEVKGKEEVGSRETEYRIQNAECRRNVPKTKNLKSQGGVQSIEKIGIGDGYVTIRVGAGENRDEFVYRAIEQGYCGMENLVSIPGTVGAAPVQNIGAYGVEVESLIASVEGVDMETGEVVRFTHDECEFGYRMSVFKGRLQGKILITHVMFRLKRYVVESYVPVLRYGAVTERVEKIAPDGVYTPLLVAQAIAQIRSEKLPDRKKVGTAGSFFKNPIVSEEVFVRLQEEFGVKGWEVVESGAKSLELRGNDTDSVLLAPSSLYKISAGQLIDMAGLKGHRIGDVGIFPDHALVLVNYGERDGRKFLELIGLIQDRVEERFGVRLEPEVNVLG